LSFAANQTQAFVTITMAEDTVEEGTETLNLTLSNASSGAVIGRTTAVGSIADNDGSLSVADVTVNENAGTAIFTLTRTSTASAGSVDYQIKNFTASSSSGDFSRAAGLTGTANFATGQNTVSVTVVINDDSLVESAETFLIELSNATQSTV
jgi:Trp operon repressor